MKTKREGSMRPWYPTHLSRRLRTSGRSCSAGNRVFFETQTFVVHELPNRTVIDLETAFACQLANQASKREVPLFAARQQPDAVLARKRPGPVSAHLARLDMPFIPKKADPIDNRARGNTKSVCRRMTAHAFSFNCTNRAFPKILGVGSSHPYRPPAPASTLNLTRGPLGIPIRFKLNSSRSKRPVPVASGGMPLN